MAEEADNKTGQDEALAEGGNYEVIRARLLEQEKSLFERTDALNAKRKETFGGTELAVIANERVRTENNCVPRDIVTVDDLLLLGYNVFIGLKSETKVSDVFALHKFEPRQEGGFDCSAVDLAGTFLDDPEFLKHFTNLYKYTRDARLLQLMKTDTQLLAVFQLGATHLEIKVFRWRIEATGAIVYVDDRGDRDYVYPRSHDFEWMPTTADDQVGDSHINIADKVFVSCAGGALSIRVENNTPRGREIHREPLDDANQVLSDAAISFAEVGTLVVLKVLPYREVKHRYFVFNTRTEHAVRLDSIEMACVQLPEDHGLLFPGGYYLQTGDYKVFDEATDQLEFKRKALSPNGEDVLYVFHRRHDGHYVLFPYNLIRKEVQTPIHCHGYSQFEDGRIVVFRAMSDEPTRVHPMQVWRTPFTSVEFAAAAPTDGSFLANVGNAELVRGISDAFSICRMIKNQEPTRNVFEDLIAATQRTIDGYYWLDNPEVGDLKSVLDEVRGTAELIIDEFEKVVAFREQAEVAVAETAERFTEITRDMRPEHWKTVDPFLAGLTALRGLRGHIITLRDMRYVDRARLDEMEAQTVERFDEVSKSCVSFLLKDEALEPLMADMQAILDSLGTVAKVADVIPLKNKVDATAEGLDLMSEVVANLQIDDATVRTRILGSISEVFSQLNRVRATIEGRRKELLTSEGKAEFAAQFQLLGQSVSSALSLSETPEKCDENLSRLMVQLEELEGRFSEFDEYLGDLAAKREEIYDAFSAKKQTLLDERQRRIENLASAANRILEGVGRRSRTLGSADELNAYFASDAMVMKLRSMAEQLTDLGDTVKSEGYLAQLKSAKQDALRGLRDKLELFEDGGNAVRFGRHGFSVNTQELELTLVPRGEGLALYLTGTDFYEIVDDVQFNETKRFWSQNLVSENELVYRGEYLAASVLFAAEAGEGGLDTAKLRAALREEKLLELVRTISQERYDEGYERGLHDQDASHILAKLLTIRESAGLLRFAPTPRACAVLFWAWYDDEEAKQRWHLQARNLGRLRASLGHSGALADLAAELSTAIAAFANAHDIACEGNEARIAGDYLLEELVADVPHFSTSADAVSLRDALFAQLERQGTKILFDEDLRALDENLRERFALAKAWVAAFLESDDKFADKRYLAVEIAVLLCDRGVDRDTTSALTTAEVDGLLGQHKRIESQKLPLRIDEFLERLGEFIHHTVPAYRDYRKQRHDLVERERKRLRLEEYMPRVMSAFVRNKLINDVYLPLIGDNLAKQIGATGEGKRTDLMGLLLLISPPGYGKTTLMEYIANRLGLVFMKVNGPALGHMVMSLDPSEAPNATARQEVEKINLAFEMGNNVMLYLDDIQHTHSELLQKFISLCDAQRRIEGVWKGQTRTYDMRGRKFCVVMAGNPYTESGDKFQIPDMLANRADTYNLGDILSGKDDAFSLSYIENSLTSNPVLAPLATREQADTYKLIRMAQGEEIPLTDLKYGYSSVEVNEIVTVFQHLFRCQKVLLSVNMQYIESASQEDRFRTEPAFKLQGSYRNMNRLAEKLVSAMNVDEVEALITDHYVGEAQTLTTGAEANLLKLREMRGLQTPEDEKRWHEIKGEFVRHTRMGGNADDPVSRVTGTLSGLSADLSNIHEALLAGANKGLDSRLDAVAGQLTGIREALGESHTTDERLSAVSGQLGAIHETLGNDQQLAALGGELGAIRQVLQAGASEGLASKLDTMGSHLAAIYNALQDAAETLERHDETAKAQAMVPVAEDRSAGGPAGSNEEWLRPYLLKIETALEALGRPQLTVETPAAVEDLLQQQVILIERTLVPIVKAATKQGRGATTLGKKLTEVLALLKVIDGRMKQGGALPT